MENLSNIGTVKSLLERHGFQFSKALGQNFLINPSVCPKIAEMGNAGPGFGILEVGAGVGVLTVELAKRADKVVSVEIDKRLLPLLDETLEEFDNIKVVNDDILKVDLHELIREEFEGLQVAVCANLPYYITSPVIMSLLEARLPIRSITVMVQKEAALRLCAQPGTRDCGAVTFAVRYFSEPKLLFHVSRGSFMPAPNVDSSVIRLDVRSQTPQVENEAFLFSLVRAAFSQRRKTLVNSVNSTLGIPKQALIETLEGLGISPTVRAEAMTLEQFIDLSKALSSFSEGKK